MARAARPGQFVIVMADDHGERVPLTIADFDRDRGTITLVIQAVGKTTRQMQQACRVGTRLHAVVGPMGIPSEIGKAKKVTSRVFRKLAGCTVTVENPKGLDAGVIRAALIAALAKLGYRPDWCKNIL